MTFEIDATYEGEIFRPDSPVACPDHSRVRLRVEQLNALAQWDATREQRLAALERFKEGIRQHPIHAGGRRFTRDQLHETFCDAVKSDWSSAK